MASFFEGKILLTSTGEIRCNCCPDPTASFTCESELIDASLCGWEEVDKDGFTPSVPPLKYRKMSVAGTGGDFNTSNCDGTSYKSFNETLSGTASCERGSLDCVKVSDGQDVYRTSTITRCVDGSPESDPSNTNSVYTSARACTESDSRWYFGLSMIPTSSVSAYVAESGPNNSKRMTRTISVVDTEEEAEARATTTNGTVCNSIWQIRSTGFSWTKQTSSYEIECANLINGLQYQVTPTIRRRTAVIGSEGSWSNITVSATTFTATSNTKSLAAVALDHIQGYEYQITGVTIEKT